MTSHHDDSTSSDLLASIREGDRDAWHRLTRVYEPLVTRWCQQFGLQPVDVQDLTQEVFLTLNNSIHQFQTGETGSFRGWLWMICRNKIIDFHRREARGHRVEGGTGALQWIQNLPDQSPETEADRTDLHLRLLAESRFAFSESVWTAFWRLAVEGDAAQDIADDLGLSLWAIYKARSRVIAKLRDDWGEDFPAC